jgi:hypothetical protein
MLPRVWPGTGRTVRSASSRTGSRPSTGISAAAVPPWMSARWMTRAQPKAAWIAAWSATSSRWERTMVRTPPSSAMRFISGLAARGESTSTLPSGLRTR